MLKSLLCPSRGTPDEDYYISPLQDRVLELLEAAGLSTETNDRIVELIAAAEREI
jgi:hypothetical protein